MDHRITRIFQGLTLTTFSMGVYNTINVIKSKESMALHKASLESSNFEMKSQSASQLIFQRKVETQLEAISSEVKAQNQQIFPEHITDAIDKATQPLMKKIEEYATLCKDINDSEKYNPDDLVKAMNRINTIGKNIEEGQKSLVSKLDKILEEIGKGGGSGSKSQYIQDISNFLNSLTFEQTVAIVNITGCVGILISLLSLFMIFYGNILIDVFQLEKRFPRIAKFIQ